MYLIYPSPAATPLIRPQFLFPKGGRIRGGPLYIHTSIHKYIHKYIVSTYIDDTNQEWRTRSGINTSIKPTRVQAPKWRTRVGVGRFYLESMISLETNQRSRLFVINESSCATVHAFIYNYTKVYIGRAFIYLCSGYI